MAALVRCSFVSDLHLDPSTPQRVDAFRTFLRRESARCDELYVLGDLFETWVGDDDDSVFVDSLRADLSTASARCRIRLMHGNRDFLVGEQFARSCGIELIDDPCVIERNQRRVLLCHGDAMCTDDVAYQRTREMLRTTAWQDGIRASPLADRRALAISMRLQSRASNTDKPATIMDVADRAVDLAAAQHRADAIVHGHTHRPGIHPIGDRGVRYVLGDWDRCGWVLRFDGIFSLLRFPLASHCET